MNKHSFLLLIKITYYNRGYFNKETSKAYELEEDKIFSKRAKEARTWISDNKHKLYPEHISGYIGHASGIEPTGKKESPIFGMSYVKKPSKENIINTSTFLLKKDILPFKKQVMEFLRWDLKKIWNI